MNRPQYTAMRLPVLTTKGISEPAARYIIDLELSGHPQDYPLILSSLAELSKTPAWTGKVVKLALSGRTLAFNGACWVLA